MADLRAAARAYREAEKGIESAKAAAEARIRAAREKAEACRTDLHAAMVDAARAGMAQKEIIEVTGYSRERVRSILRAGGIEPD
ncbi:hypothetical protein GCM10009557_11590 [Virgisporangium ochraceum]|uniref:Uncharacterized protein n=1 Tax=Virgisporangium ochraceum TaxID=65505 RepID=A0A8J3ZYX2_9ACTN|nr:hypothetical protein [Virgisporangium ochraceum]GIJ69891.1 hypothetical protein Voc01_048080 [Virgisporangium ochraceum]